MTGPARRSLVVDIGPLRETYYTGIPNVIAELCTRLLREPGIDLYFDLDGLWVDSESLRMCLETRSGTSLVGGSGRFRPATEIREHLDMTGQYEQAVALYMDHRPPVKLYRREGKIVYDLSLILVPECHTPLAIEMYTSDLDQQIACTDIFFCISQSTARDLAWAYGVPPERIRVALLGNNVDLTFSERARGLIAGRPVEPYLLVLGSIEPRKNAVLVLDWLARDPSVLARVRVVFAGRQAWGDSFGAMIEARGLQGAVASGRIVYMGFVDERLKATLLAGAAALLYPSLFEGFGLPLLEAMATGTPVLSSCSTSMPEVVGECGYYFDPVSTGSLGAAFERLWCDLASGALAGMVAAARERAAGFSYDGTFQVVMAGLFEQPRRSGQGATHTRHPPEETR